MKEIRERKVIYLLFTAVTVSSKCASISQTCLSGTDYHSLFVEAHLNKSTVTRLEGANILENEDSDFESSLESGPIFSSDLALFLNTELSEGLKKQLVHVGPYRPERPISGFANDDSNRSFSEVYYKKRTSSGQLLKRFWISYSVTLNGVYCHPCWLFADRSSTSFNPAWTTGMLNDWKCLSKKILTHENARVHLDACLVYSTWKAILSEDDVNKYLLGIKSKCTGHDDLSIDMLILCCPYILPYITHIINTCFLYSTFPEAWKISRVIPLPKKDIITTYNDLRPISILPVLSKLLEKIMNSQILKHVNHYDILPPRQSGFRKGFSCATTLLDVNDDILKDLDQGKTVALVLLDYSKAFDTINHSTLLAILHFLGFSSNSINMLKSYLNNRLQFVQTGRGKSGRANICCGVPQGSILGPLLFCLYTCNLGNILRFCTPYFYADDTQLKFSFYSDNILDANKIINDDLTSLVLESKKHHLLINAQKSTILVFGRFKENFQNSLRIIVDGDDLKCSREAKNLGIIMDTNLRYEGHISKCIKKAYSSLKMLYPHRHILSQTLKLKLTDSLVLSHFNYCDVVYGPCLDKVNINRIEKVQKSCLRYTYGIRKYDPISYKLQEFAVFSFFESSSEDVPPFAETGFEVMSNLPLQMSLYFNVIFVPLWGLLLTLFLVENFYSYTELYKFIVITILSTIFIMEILRLYLGYEGNLKDKRILKNTGMYNYKFLKVQGLVDAHFQRRERFCTEFLGKIDEDNYFLGKIIWTDEAKFSREGIVNLRKTYMWSGKEIYNKNLVLTFFVC
ncbi:unnamed protein product [Brassicogethes aeneus]|uniref:Reverse transcriptase domain-containing protein n=1 Tax=Brassicogethes aeneus TaxID=1431903 RepID=A0A9P0B540_BRAAE|nr:unnamed protein product [Brassicogethes aeneus]